MPIMFNSILQSEGLDLEDVRLLRHQARKAEKGRSPYELWLNDRPSFEQYQAMQDKRYKNTLNAKYWASFVVTPNDETMFVGIFQNLKCSRLSKNIAKPHMNGINKRGSCDYYKLKQDYKLGDFTGKLIIDWGKGCRSWIQYPSRQNKIITELRPEFSEPEFPGLLYFISPLSKLQSLPNSWISVLKCFQGVYLLTCPKTGEQYVGSATGELGFWRRMQDYVRNGNGGNICLKSRNPSDYSVSILEVAGSATTSADVLRMESNWKLKLQSRAMGLNRN